MSVRKMQIPRALEHYIIRKELSTLPDSQSSIALEDLRLPRLRGTPRPLKPMCVRSHCVFQVLVLSRSSVHPCPAPLTVLHCLVHVEAQGRTSAHKTT